MLATIAVKARVTCKACGTSIAVNRFHHAAKCACGESTKLPWQRVLHDMLARIDQVAFGTHDRSSGPSMHFDLWKREAACPACSAALVAPLAFGDDHRVRCACGARTSLRRAPKDLAQLDARIQALYDEDEPTAKTHAVANAALDPRCRGCGAALVIAGDRSVRCSYCETDNVLSDEVWGRLHPPARRTELWHIVLELAANDVSRTG